MDEIKPGLVVLLGSGETLPSSGNTHEYVAKHLPENPKIAILETPAGFELNAEKVAGKIAEYLTIRLQNYSPTIIQIPARKKGTAFSPDIFEIVGPLLQADEILLGPGSPTYAVRQLQESLALEIIKARHRLGAALVLSSAATLAFGRHTIPVYEIFKVGEDPHWKQGLDYWSLFGLELSVVPHWNNNDGGEDLDTTRCYIGQSRFEMLLETLPESAVILGIDDHTSVVLDFAANTGRVMGKGSVHVLREGGQQDFASGQKFDLRILGEARLPAAGQGIRPQIWQQALEAQQALHLEEERTLRPPQVVLSILEKRKAARNAEEWQKADKLRGEIEALGWKVMDTPEGVELIPMEDYESTR